MARRSSSRRTAAAARAGAASNERNGGGGGDNGGDNVEEDGQRHRRQPPAERSVAPRVREWQRAVAEREASRLARPEAPRKSSLEHADRKKSAVTSTPFGVLTRQDKDVKYDPGAWCGPFTVARQMIAEREEAKRKREAELEEEGGGGGEAKHPLDEAMIELDQERKRRAHPSLSWKSHRMPTASGADTSSNIYVKRQKRAEIRSSAQSMPSLFETCVEFLVDNFDCVESLGFVESDVRTAIVRELVARNKLDGTAFDALIEIGMDALEVIDCSQLSQDIMSSCLKKLLPKGLRYLVLDQAGCCFGPKTVGAVLDACSQSPSKKLDLFALSVGGAYLLKDADAAKLVSALSKSVSSLEFKACPMLGTEVCKAIAESYGDDAASNGLKSVKLLELSLEDLPALNGPALETLVSKPSALGNLKSLSLRRIDGLTDKIVLRLLEAAGPGLEQLDLSDNNALTDETLSGIRRFCCAGALKALNLAGLRRLTGHGLEALFLHVPGLDPPPSLRALDFGKCDHEAVTDDLMKLVVEAASTRVRGEGDKIEQLEFQGGLVRLNLQGSTAITDTSLEYLAKSCSSSLEAINLSFCPKVSDKGLGYLVDNCSDRLSKVEIWGCAQVSEEFLDGHRRVSDPEFEITGAWIKKNTMS